MRARLGPYRLRSTRDPGTKTERVSQRLRHHQSAHAVDRRFHSPLVARLLAWALEGGALTVRLCVVEDNDVAERLYRRHGFTRTDGAEVRSRDGRVEIGLERFLSA